MTLPLSVMSRIALPKMIILPKLLYYFSNLPIYVPARQFRELEALLRDLIWNKGRPRMALWKIFAPFDNGGLAVPNLELYYLAAQLQWLTKWLGSIGLMDTATEQQPWSQLQIYSHFHPLARPPRPTQIHLALAHRCYRRSLYLTRHVSPYAPSIPIAGMPRRQTIVTEREFTSWHAAGLETLSDLYEDATLLSFETLTTEQQLPAGQFLLYNAVIRSLTDTWGDMTEEPPTHQLMQYLHIMGEGSHVIHWIVDALLIHTLQPMTKLREHWTVDRGRPWTEKEWSTILASSTYIPRNAKFRLIHTYIVQRAYLSPDKINKYFNITTSACPRCHQVDADLLHMIWSCTSLQTYWCGVADALTRSTKMQLAFT